MLDSPEAWNEPSMYSETTHAVLGYFLVRSLIGLAGGDSLAKIFSVRHGWISTLLSVCLRTPTSCWKSSHTIPFLSRGFVQPSCTGVLSSPINWCRCIVGVGAFFFCLAWHMD